MRELTPNECGRRLYAAILSCHRNHPLMADIYEFETPKPIEVYWEEVAAILMRLTRARLEKQINRDRVTKGALLPWPESEQNTEPDF
jgi:hypothetical protein